MKDVSKPLDSTEAGILLVLIVLLLLLNSFFSLIETALMEGHKSRLERLADEEGDDAEDARAALAILDAPEDALSVTQIGITLMGILLGIASGVLLAPLLARHMTFLPHAQAIALVLSIVVMTYIMLLFGEFLPKRTALQKPEEVLLKHHKALTRLTHFTKPLVSLLSHSAGGILLVLGFNPKYEDTVTEDEVKDLIEQGTEDGTFEKTEQDMVDRVFHLSDQTAYALMTPRTQMLWLDLEDSLRHNLRVIRQTPQTIFPVGRENLDDFCGILYAKDLLNASLTHKSLELSQYLRKPMFVPRSMELFRLLEKFRDTGIHEAMVLDEYGGVIGMTAAGHAARRPFVVHRRPLLHRRFQGTLRHRQAARRRPRPLPDDGRLPDIVFRLYPESGRDSDMGGLHVRGRRYGPRPHQQDPRDAGTDACRILKEKGDPRGRRKHHRLRRT